MSGKAVWTAFPNANSVSKGTDIFDYILKETTNAETGKIEWTSNAFSVYMKCEVNHNDKAKSRIYIKSK